MLDCILALLEKGYELGRGYGHAQKTEGPEAEGRGEFEVVEFEVVSAEYCEGLEVDGSLDEPGKMERITIVWKSCILCRHICRPMSLPDIVRPLSDGQGQVSKGFQDMFDRDSCSAGLVVVEEFPEIVGQGETDFKFRQVRKRNVSQRRSYRVDKDPLPLLGETRREGMNLESAEPWKPGQARR